MALSRRSFLWLAAVIPTAASTPACRAQGTPEEELIDLLGLTPEQKPWLSSLQPADQQYLVDALSGRGADDDRRTRDLLFQLIQPRDRLFSYVGYPEVSARRSICDGVFQE